MVIVKFGDIYFNKSGEKVIIPPAPGDTVLVIDGYGVPTATKGWALNISEHMAEGFYCFETTEGYLTLHKSDDVFITRIIKKEEEFNLYKLAFSEMITVTTQFWDEIVFKSTGERSFLKTLAIRAGDRNFILKRAFAVLAVAIVINLTGSFTMSVSKGVDDKEKARAKMFYQRLHQGIQRKSGSIVSSITPDVYSRVLPLVTRGVFCNITEYSFTNGMLIANVEMEGSIDASYLSIFGRVRQEGNKVSIQL